MSLTFAQARDEILTMFKVGWDANSAAIAGSIPPVTYDNLEDLDPPGSPWARVKVEHTDGNQASLAGSAGTSRFEREGLLTVSIYITIGIGTVMSDGLAKVVADIYEGKHSASGEVWFRNVRPNEVGAGEKWFQVDLLANFIYDEIK